MYNFQQRISVECFIKNYSKHSHLNQARLNSLSFIFCKLVINLFEFGKKLKQMVKILFDVSDEKKNEQIISLDQSKNSNKNISNRCAASVFNWPGLNHSVFFMP